MNTQKHTTIKVSDYGDMLSQVFDAELVAYQEYGSYQGEYLAVLNEKGIYKFYMDSYGSCSGCDWIEAERGYEGEVSYKAALDYCNQITLKFAIPKILWVTLTDEQKKLLVDDEMCEAEDMRREIIKIK